MVWCPTDRRPVTDDAVAVLPAQVNIWSSRTLGEEFPSPTRRLPTLWTNLVATAVGAPLEIIKPQVENQHNRQPPLPPHGSSREFLRR